MMNNNPGNPTSPMPQGPPPPPGAYDNQPSIHVNQQSQQQPGMMNQQPGMNNNYQQQQQQPGSMHQPGMNNYQQPGGMNNYQQPPGMMQTPPQQPQQPTLNNTMGVPLNQPGTGMMQPPPQQPTQPLPPGMMQRPGMMMNNNNNNNPQMNMNNSAMMNSGMMQPPQQPQMQPNNGMNRSPPPSGVPQQPTANSPANNNNNRGAGMLGSRLPRPPYQDPQTNIMYDCDQAEYEGWLTKQSMWLKDWRRRYFILKGNKLFFAKNEYQAPHGMIDLAHCTTVKSADWKSKKRHSFEISTPEITYLLYADTESEKDDWIGRVGKAIVRCSRTYVGQGGTSQGQHSTVPGGNSYMQQQQIGGDDSEDDDDIYENDDMENPYYND